MSRHRVRIILAATLFAALAGCGQKGPLYLPADETEALPADAATDPATDPAASPESAEESGDTPSATN